MISELLHLPAALPEWQTLALVGALCALAIFAASVEEQSAATGRISDNVSNAAKGTDVVVTLRGEIQRFLEKVAA